MARTRPQITNLGEHVPPAPPPNFCNEPLLSKAEDPRRIWGGLSFANRLLGDSAPLHLPGTCLPTLALRRDTCPRRTHPDRQCTPNSGRSGAVRSCSPTTSHPHSVLELPVSKSHWADGSRVGRTCPRGGQLQTWQALWRGGTGRHCQCGSPSDAMLP